MSARLMQCQSSTVASRPRRSRRRPRRSAVERGVVGHDGAGLQDDAGADARRGRRPRRSAPITQSRRTRAGADAHALPEDRRPRRTRPRRCAQPSPTTARGPPGPAPHLDAGADCEGRAPGASGARRAVGAIQRAVAPLARRRQRRAHAPVQQVDLGLAVRGRAADVAPVGACRSSRKPAMPSAMSAGKNSRSIETSRPAGIRSSRAASMR